MEEARIIDSKAKEIIPLSGLPELPSKISCDPSSSETSDIHNVNGPNINYRVAAGEEEKSWIISCHNLMKVKKPDRSPHSEFKTRVYQVWQGKNVFFFGGRLICGPDPKGFFLTMVSIILSSWIFVAYIGRDLSEHSYLIITISVILTVIVFVNLVMVSSTDPGIIPRNDQPSSNEEMGTSNGVRKRRTLSVNGVNMKLKYCRICKIFRPPRSCHCAICDNCVEKFDHHCPWIGQCIGLRNYRFYLAFISSALVYFIYIFIFSSFKISRRMSETGSGLFETMRNCPETIALASFSFISACFLGGLTTFHLYLIMQNQTGYENFRKRYMGSLNPYDKGILSNIKEVLFVKMAPSRVDFREVVLPPPRGDMKAAMPEMSGEVKQGSTTMVDKLIV